MTNEERFRQLLGETLPPKKWEDMTKEERFQYWLDGGEPRSWKERWNEPAPPPSRWQEVQELPPPTFFQEFIAPPLRFALLFLLYISWPVILIAGLGEMVYIALFQREGSRFDYPF